MSEFAFEYEPDKLILDDEEVRLVSPLELSGKVIKGSAQVELKGKIKTTAAIQCDRCLSEVVVNIENEFDVTYVPDSIYDAANKLELQDDDLTLSVFGGDAIDVDELAVEQFYLALPTRVLCREDCQGLCPKCAVNKNNESCSCEVKEIDPRWGALKDLKLK